MTPRQEALLESALAAIEPDERVLAAWLGGSFGQGTADEWSDIDLHACVDDSDLELVEVDLPALRARIHDSLLSRQLGAARFGVVGFWSVDHAWDHVDVMFYGRSHLAANPPNGFVPLFDHAGVLPTDATWSRPSTPWFPRDLVETFIYVVGHQPIVAGRRETAFMQLTTGMLTRDFLVKLMFAENGLEPHGGTLRLTSFLSDEQLAELDTMPPITNDHGELVEAMRWLVGRFTTRARALAERLGEDYPDALERSARRHAGF